MIYMSPAMARYVPRKMVMSTWVDHIPFAYDIVEAAKPEILVELGSHEGMSFFAFCQSMQENNVDGSCYAIDTWAGDEHTGAYGDEVHDAVRDHLRQEYWGFTYMMRMLFNDAATHFSDETVDLCHIDGLHTYEAVSEDLATWYPKVKPGGIILFHDVLARMEGYGTPKFWEETVAGHPETFTFNHGFGLGVLRKPGGDRSNDAPLVKALFESDDRGKADLRELYVNISRYVQLRRRAKNRPDAAK